MQSVIEQKIRQYIYIYGDRPTNDSQGELKGEFTCKLGGVSESSLLRSDGSDGEPEPCERWPKAIQGGHQARVHSDQMVRMMTRQ